MSLDDPPGLRVTAVRFAREPDAMASPRLSIRIDLASGDRIGPGKIALLEAIRATGSISAGARSLGMSYRRAWLLVEEVNDALREPAVTAETGGRSGGGAVVTPVGKRVIDLYRTIETTARNAAGQEFRAMGKLVRPQKTAS
jgi:molybdate transport system regulatory protein